MHLGDKIVLTGFKDLDRNEMVVVRKMVGTYVKKYIELDEGFQNLKLRLKTTHEREQSVIFELDGNYTSDSNKFDVSESNRNLFMVLDSVLKKIQGMLKNQKDKQ